MDSLDSCSIGTESDSGVGRSFHSVTNRSSRAQSTTSAIPQDIRVQQLWEAFHTAFWYNRIPLDFMPAADNQLEYLSLWSDVIQIEAWILEKMAQEKTAIEAFFQEIKLFSVRTGPPQLLSALHNFGLLQQGEQLTNGLTAYQTAVLWRNSDALSLFGSTDPQTVFLQLDNNAENLEYFNLLSPLDSAVFCYTGDPEDLVQFLRPSLFNPQTLPLLLRLKSSIDGKSISDLFFKAIKEGENMLVDTLLSLFGVSIHSTADSTEKTGLHIAATKGHVALIRLLLLRGANPNAMTHQNELPEDLAERGNKKPIVALLNPARNARFDRIRGWLRDGGSLDQQIVPADFSATDENGEGILEHALEYSDKKTLESLLKTPGCSINSQNCRTGRSILIDAVAKRRCELVTILLENGASPCIRDVSDMSALDIAIDQDDKEIVSTMMAFPQCWTGLHSAMSHSKSGEMTEILQAAFKRRQDELVKPLLFSLTTGDQTNLSSSLGQLEQGDLVNVRNERDESPTYLAAKNGCTESLQVIVELGGQFWLRHCRTLETTLHVAAAGGFSETIKFLIDCFRSQKRKLNLDELDNDGKTPLHRAAENGHTDAVRTLLDHGASPNGYVSRGVIVTSEFEATQSLFDEYRLPRQVLIFRSIEKGNLKTLKDIWESNFDHYLRNHNGDTPIMVAAQLDNSKILEFLLESAEQEYRPYELDLNIQHDANVECMLQRIESRPDLASNTPSNSSQPPRRRQLTCFQWIFGRTLPDQPEFTPTLFLSENRLNHISSTNLNDGCCAVHRVIEVADNVDMVKRLAAKDSFCLNIQEHNGFTPLHLAIILRRPKIVRYLIKHDITDFYATDLLGRLPEELADSPKSLEMIRTARTQPSSWWATMCDEQIPLSTADGLSNWTNQFKSVNWSTDGPASPGGSSAQISIFAGKTSASQDGVYEFIDRNRSARNSRAGKEPPLLQSALLATMVASAIKRV